jgi:hypothetical protein
MLRVVTVVQQIKTQFNGAVSEEAKIVAITNIVLNLMICSAKPSLTEDLCVVQKEEISVSRYMCEMYT